MDTLEILRKIGGAKLHNFSLEASPSPTCIAEIHKRREKTKYACISERGNIENGEVPKTMGGILPYIPLNLERFIIIFSGASGDGKTLLTSNFIQQYNRNFSENKIYYVCPTKLKDDISLSKIKHIMKQIFTNDVDESYTENERWRNSLIVYDDIDGDENSKLVNKFLNSMIVKGRKYGTSIIFISHDDTHKKFSTIDKEVSLYITSHHNLRDNRMLSTYMKLSPSKIIRLTMAHDAFICINKRCNYIITDTRITKLPTATEEKDRENEE